MPSTPHPKHAACHAPPAKQAHTPQCSAQPFQTPYHITHLLSQPKVHAQLHTKRTWCQSCALHLTSPRPAPPPQGTKGEYLESLRDTYTLPEGVFTEAMEKVHGRLAMVGLGGLVLVELLKGSALL